MSGYNKRYKALVSSTQSFFHFSSYLWVCFFFFSFLFVDKGLSRTKKTLEYLQKRAEGVPTPQDWFLEAYVITREADSLFVSKNYLEAEKKYKIAYNLLGSIKSNYPEWESAIVRYRTKYVKEKLDSVMRINAQNSDVKKKYLEEELPESNPLINPQQQVSLQELQSLKNKIAELTAQLENMKKEKEALLENLPYNQPRSKMEQPKAGKNFQFQGMTTKEISLLPKVQDQSKNRQNLTNQLQKALAEAKRTAQQLKEENDHLKKELQQLHTTFKNPQAPSPRGLESRQLDILARENELLKKTVSELAVKQKKVQQENEALSQELAKANRLLAFLAEKEDGALDKMSQKVSTLSRDSMHDTFSFKHEKIFPHQQTVAMRKGSVLQEIQELFDQGAKLYSEKRYEEAYEIYKRILALDPSNGIGWLNLGLVAMAKERNSEASVYLKRAVEYLPHDPMAYALLGQIYFQSGAYAAATEVVEKAVKLDPQNAKLRKELGEIYKARGLELLAARELKKAIELNPYDGMAHFDLALVYVSCKPPLLAQAKEHYKNALSLGIPKDERLEQKIGYSDTQK
ncbi:hypothetical protein A7Q10_08240 [Methylacidiphilum caldifontis]|uniref:Uncharacterized protein n=1 Tax=Methylacidiphilum caldifontis TaxID=2795386 RepID=A0A4Y8PBU2_9BACT|nr:hypothetical protein A7Q10_08240 [Methylacidiphilum caldifontis]